MGMCVHTCMCVSTMYMCEFVCACVCVCVCMSVCVDSAAGCSGVRVVTTKYVPYAREDLTHTAISVSYKWGLVMR